MTSDLKRGLDPNGAFKIFFSDPLWRINSGVGAMIGAAALLLLAFNKLLIPASFALWALLVGYNLRIIRTKLADINAPLPLWTDWPDLFISGLTWIAISVGFLLVGYMLFFFGIVGLAALSASLPPTQYLIWTSLIVCTLALITVKTSFLTTVLMINFAKEERTAAGFQLPTVIKRVIKSPVQFVEAWLLMIGLYFVGVFFPIVTIVGMFLFPFFSFIMQSVSSIILAQAWRDSDSIPS